MVGINSTIAEMFREIREANAKTITITATDEDEQVMGMVILVAPDYVDEINRQLGRDESFFADEESETDDHEEEDHQ